MQIIHSWEELMEAVAPSVDASVPLGSLGYVNIGPEHMPAGVVEHLDYLRRLAARGERDES